MTETTLELVQVWTGEVGQVKYRTEDGWVGVALLNEDGRVDEWPSDQVWVITAGEAGYLAAQQLAK